MVDGGQQITSIETHLQTGSELFDTDPKGALAAYYQAVSIEPSHIEGWNQIGRLMFDMQQYSEADMVFSRVEQLANEQNLPDWAEMAHQNIELTRQTLGEQAPVETAQPEAAQPEAAQQEPIMAAVEPAVVAQTVNEENKSIADISNIAAVAELPVVSAVSETAVLQQAQTAVVEPVVAAIPAVEVPMPPIEVAAPVEIPMVAAEPAIAETPAVTTALPEAPVITEPAISVIPAAPIPTVPLAQRLSGAALPVVGQTVMQAPEPQQSAQIVAHGQPPMQFQQPAPHQAQGLHQDQLPGQPQNPPSMLPPNPFPLQPTAQNGAPALPTIAAPSEPLPVSPPADARMEAPKSSSSKIALMITGVVAAAGIGIGGAQYLNTNGVLETGIPIVKSEAKLVAKPVVKAPKIVAKPKVPRPDNTGRDQAYKIGMTHVVKGEFNQAKAYLEQAEALGHAEAGYNLASLYAKGDGVEQDFKKAVGYLRKSADRGYHPAMTNLGLLYAQGQGVEQNYLTARALWVKAAAGEHPDAMHNLAVIYATGKGVDKDMDEAVKWYRKGANAGYVDSIANLGLIYANGDGVPRDYDEAKRLWETAAGKGHKVATQNLEKLKQVMAQ